MPLESQTEPWFFPSLLWQVPSLDIAHCQQGLFSADFPVPAAMVFSSTAENLVWPAALHLNLGPMLR